MRSPSLFLAIAALATLIAPIARAQPSGDIDAALARLEARAADLPPEAVRAQARELLSRDTDPRVLTGLTSVALKLVSSDEATRALAIAEPVVEAAPDYAPGWSSLALAKLLAERFAESAAALERAYALQPEAGTLFRLSFAQELGGAPREARHTLDRLLVAYPRRTDALFRSAMLAHYGTPAGAVDALERYIEAARAAPDPRGPKFLEVAGLLRPLAAEGYRSADAYELGLKLAAALLHDGEGSAIMGLTGMLAKVNPSDPEPHMLRAAFYGQIGARKLEQAALHAARERLRPDSDLLLYETVFSNLSRLALRSGDWAGAKAVANQSAARLGRHTWHVYLRARLAAHAGEAGEATALFAQCAAHELGEAADLVSGLCRQASGADALRSTR